MSRSVFLDSFPLKHITARASKAFKTSKNNMEYGPIPESRFVEVIEFLRKVSRDEPLNSGIGLWKKDFPCELVERMDLKTLQDGLSIMVTDTSTGQIVAVALNGIERRGDIELGLDAIKDIDCEEYHHKLGLLLRVSKEADLFNKYGVEEIFELSLICVDVKYRGQGIARKLFIMSVLIAEEHGFKLMKADATSFYSQKIAESIGMKTEIEINYKNFQDKQGRRIYEKVEPPHDCYRLVVKQLPSKKISKL